MHVICQRRQNFSHELNEHSAVDFVVEAFPVAENGFDERPAANFFDVVFDFLFGKNFLVDIRAAVTDELV